MSVKKAIFLFCGLLLPFSVIAASANIPIATFTQSSANTQTMSVNFQILIMMTLLTVLPGIVMATTAFARIIIVLSILRQAIGMAQTPTNQILIGISLFLTFFVMTPVLEVIEKKALQPYMADKLDFNAAIKEAAIPLKRFMMGQTRNSDLALFEKLGRTRLDPRKPEEASLAVLIPSFITSELKTAFQIGFILFLPFLIIDMVVASVLMAMGMMMLSPLIISLPFKIMLFVLVDGWTLVLGSLASSFAM